MRRKIKRKRNNRRKGEKQLNLYNQDYVFFFELAIFVRDVKSIFISGTSIIIDFLSISHLWSQFLSDIGEPYSKFIMSYASYVIFRAKNFSGK